MKPTEIKCILKQEIKFQEFFSTITSICAILCIGFGIIPICSKIDPIISNWATLPVIILSFIFSYLLYHSAKVDILKKVLEIEEQREKDHELNIREQIPDSWKIKCYDDWKKEYLKIVDKVDNFHKNWFEMELWENAWSDYYQRYQKEIKNA